MSNNDALREALSKLRAAGQAHPAAAACLAEEARELLEQALAASKPGPQAQAGEPEVVSVAFVLPSEKTPQYQTKRVLPAGKHELITQAQEAMK